MRETFELVMTRTERGKDGPAEPVRTYVEGETYRVGQSLYRAFVTDLGVARPAGGRENKTVGPSETKPRRKRP